MKSKVFVGDELVTSLKVDGEQFAPVACLLTGRTIQEADIKKLFDAYVVLRKGHPRLHAIKVHIIAVLESMQQEPLTPLGRSLHFEEEGISFHVMQITLWSTVKSTFSDTLKGFFRPMSANTFKKIIRKEQ